MTTRLKSIGYPLLALYNSASSSKQSVSDTYFASAIRIRVDYVGRTVNG